MKCPSIPFLVALCLVAAQAGAQAPLPARSPTVSTVSAVVNVLTCDVVASGKIEDSGTIEESEVVMPLEDKPTKQRLHKFRIRTGRILRDTAGDTPVFTNTVVDVFAVVTATVTNPVGSRYQKNLGGIFLLKRLAGRKELLLSRRAEPIEEARYSAIAADVESLPWGQVSNGLQMVVLQLAAPAVSTNGGSVRVGVAVRNVSNGPVAVGPVRSAKMLTVRVDGTQSAILEQPSSSLSSSNAPSPRVVNLLPKQVAMLAPGARPESGFAVSVPAGEAWSLSATYDSGSDDGQDKSLWKGRLESGALAVKVTRPVRMPPRFRRPVPVAGETNTVPASAAGQKLSPVESLKLQPTVPTNRAALLPPLR